MAGGGRRRRSHPGGRRSAPRLTGAGERAGAPPRPADQPAAAGPAGSKRRVARRRMGPVHRARAACVGTLSRRRSAAGADICDGAQPLARPLDLASCGQQKQMGKRRRQHRRRGGRGARRRGRQPRQALCPSAGARRGRHRHPRGGQGHQAAGLRTRLALPQLPRCSGRRRGGGCGGRHGDVSPANPRRRARLHALAGVGQGARAVARRHVAHDGQYAPVSLDAVSLRALPDIISVLRIILVGPVARCLIAGRSDGIDGYLAKHYSLQSRLGSILDPLADNLLLVTTYVVLAWLEVLPVWLTAAVVARDTVLVAGALAFHWLIGRYEMAPSFISKLNTVAQIVLAVAAVASLSILPLPVWVLHGLILLVLATTLLSGADYVWTWGARAYRARGAARRRKTNKMHFE